MAEHCNRRDALLLGENAPGDIRDTTSPRAMAGLMRAVLCGDVLSRPSRERLEAAHADIARLVSAKLVAPRLDLAQ